jgi:glycosyltransferase involved in cell wall biosynthesis
VRIALVSDAWEPQVNGVVRTLRTTVDRLRARGHQVETMTPDGFRTRACPGYPEIRLALGCGTKLSARLTDLDPEAIHIATEGPLGWAARNWCLAHDMPFTTSFHTRFPDYLALRTHMPARWFWPILRRFHRPSSAVFAATDALAQELATFGLSHTHRWSRGVDITAFSPDAAPLAAMSSLPRPIQLYVGRVAIEKNIEAFLDTNVPGAKVVIGDGPALKSLRQRYPAAHFLGALHGAELAAAYATADVLVFPSRTDTFGLVVIEALASGTPVAAYPVRGPIDIIGAMGRGFGGNAGRIGALDENLNLAIRVALGASSHACVEEGQRYDWERCTDQFLAGLRPGRPTVKARRRLFAMA